MNEKIKKIQLLHANGFPWISGNELALWTGAALKLYKIGWKMRIAPLLAAVNWQKTTPVRSLPHPQFDGAGSFSKNYVKRNQTQNQQNLAQ